MPADLIFPDWQNKSRRSYTKTMMPQAGTPEPTIELSPIDMLAMEVWAMAMQGSPPDDEPKESA